jgi:hypothetical protein
VRGKEGRRKMGGGRRSEGGKGGKERRKEGRKEKEDLQVKKQNPDNLTEIWYLRFPSTMVLTCHQ